MKRVTYILLFLLLSITAYAQRAPITVTTILTPPYTTSLSTMAESGSTRLMVNLLVNDVTITEIPVKLHIKMESSGITIESIPTQAVRPMFLGGGEARVLTGDDFAQYFNLNNLNFKGFSKEAYIKNGQLPAGLWKFSVSVRHFYTNKTISNIGTVTAWITSYKPPMLTSPKDGEIAPSNAALPLTFSWQASKHTGGTAAIMYRFEMWERRVEGVPAQAVAASVPPIYTTETAGLTATVLPATLALEPGMKYCWRVTAYDPSGMVTIENKGESEVRTFQYLEKCPEVCGLTVDIKDDTGYASWEENRMHLGGYNFEFYDDEGTCHKTLWGSSTRTAGIGGEYGKTWHVRVQGLCRSSVEGPWSDWVDFKIPDAFKPLKDENGNTYECGREVPERVITNFELIDNIQKGDTLEDERGTTKYIIHSATKNEDGSFRGLSYMKLSIWGVKVLGEYNNMKVNTDGVIIGRYAWKSVKSDLLVADPEAIEKWADELALEMAGATYNNTIKDTIVLEYSQGYVRFETIRREGDKYFAVTSDNKDVEITSMINGKTRALVQDGDGHELVIDKDGNVMGVEEYKKCGGSAKLLSEHNAYRDSTMATSGNVKFSKIKDETYGFDEWRGADYDKDVYDNFNGYRPTYIGAQKSSNIKVAASQTKGIRFITERGVPIIANTANNTLNLAIGTAGKQTVYAYSDSTLVGKLCIQAYDPKEVKVHVVRVNNGKQLELNKIADEVNRIYSSAIVHYTFDELDPIKIEYANKQHFVHGGKGTFQNYNADQKTAIKALPKTADPNDYYLFFTDCYNRLDTAGNTSKEAVNGYMPVGRHYGFIYNEYTNARTIAHELGHGTNSLHHTFSQESESFYTTKETDNLMDYHTGEYLNHRQWQWSHEKHRNVLGFLDDEGESEMRENTSIKWLGDWLEGYYYDDLEKETESNLPIFNKMFESYNDLKIKAKDEHQTFGINKYYTIICTSPTFCVENYPTLRLDNKYYDKGQKLRNIYDKFSNSGNVDFQGAFLSDRNIYLEEYKLEGIEYKLALYAGNELSLSCDKYSIKTFSELRDNKNIKVGYTSKFALIVLYKQNMPYLTIQIIGGDPKTSAIKWTNYLSLICYSETQSVADRSILEQVQIYGKEKLKEIWSASFKSEDFKKLQQIEELTPKEIREYREFIKTLPEDERADWYLELQKKVPYHNQKDNTPDYANNSKDELTTTDAKKNNADRMCNVTSLAMAFEILGVSKEDAVAKLKEDGFETKDIESKDFEDIIDYIRVKKGFTYVDNKGNEQEALDRTSVIFWKKVAEYLGVTTQTIELYSSDVNSNKWDAHKPQIENALKEGDGIVLSLFRGAGHIVRLQGLSDNGIIIDDPYGKLRNMAVRELPGSTTGSYNANERNMSLVSGQKGKDVTITWNELNVGFDDNGCGGDESVDGMKVWYEGIDKRTKTACTFYMTDWANQISPCEYIIEDKEEIDKDGNVKKTSRVKCYGGMVKYCVIFKKQ